MAEVANSMNSSTPTSTDSGQIMAPESPESVLLSPSVKEAMDRIFPRSASQLLSKGFSLDDDAIMNNIPMETNMEKLHPARISGPSSSVVNSTSLTSTVATTHTTTVTTTASSAVSPCYATCMSDRVSPFVSHSAMVPTDSPPITPAHCNNESDRDAELNHKDGEWKDKSRESNSLDKSSQPQKKYVRKISKADLEIMKSNESLVNEAQERTSRRMGSVDISSSECHSRGGSDSDDMRKPFANVAREKKKYKKKKKGTEQSSDKSDRFLQENVTFLENDVQTLGKTSNDTVENSDTDEDVSLKELRTRTKESIQALSQDTFSSNQGSHDSYSQNTIFENGSLSKDGLYRDGRLSGEDFSNISYSSSKENLHCKKKKSRQKLPRTKRQHYNIVKHQNKIRHAFPPCFVVMKKIEPNVTSHFPTDSSVVDSILPLSVRVKDLLDLCDKGSVACRKRKKVVVVEDPVYKNIFEENMLPGHSEDEFEQPRGKRSLRKRDKNISYVEPSEDDILDEFSRKRRQSKHKDVVSQLEDEGVSENKKRKKQTAADGNKQSVVDRNKKQIAPDGNKKQTAVDGNKKQSSVDGGSENATENKRDKMKLAGKERIDGSTAALTANVKDARITGGKEIIVYPPSSVCDELSYRIRSEGRNRLAAKIAEKAKHGPPVAERVRNSAPILPASSHVSVLPPNTAQGPLPPTGPTSIFTSLPLNFSTPLTGQPMLAGSSLHNAASVAGMVQKPPQYCMMKMGGKDVLLQLVPSSSGNIGLPVPGSQALVLPGGKKVYMPPPPPLVPSSSLFSQSVGQSLSLPVSTQAMPAPFTAVPVVSQGNVSSTPLQSLLGIPVISRPLPTALPNISLTAAQLAGLTSSASVRPLTSLSTGTFLSPSSLASSVAPANVMASTAPAAVRPTTSVAPALSVGFTPMPAPNTTNVVRTVRVPAPNLRAVVPNQSGAIRSVRIFVPGCTATGTPGRFATLGSVATGSPLTRLTASSELLPQRKHSVEKDLTPEQRAARRRKLEKKYPLPPGVVIKTEPLDNPPKQPSVNTTAGGSRSLLPQNLHLLSSTSRPGTSVQSIRIISPSLASALSARGLRGNSNVIYRAASVGRGQTVLVPTSLGMISTALPSTTTVTTTASLTTSSAPCASTATSATTASVTSSSASSTDTVTVCTSSISTVMTTATSVSSTSSPSSPRNAAEKDTSSGPGDVSIPPALTLEAPSAENSNNNNDNSLITTSRSTSNSPAPELVPEALPAVTSSSSIETSTNSITTSSEGHSTTTCSDEDQPSSTTIAPQHSLSSLVSDNNQVSTASSQDVATLDSLRARLGDLRKLIQAQEARGLKGERLNKLRELLKQKEDHLEEMEKLSETSIPSVSRADTPTDDVSSTGNNGSSEVTIVGHEGSETDPFVID